MKMNNFDQQLLRLKAAIGVTDDQEVAALLGLTKAAFSARKTRGAFPVDKLLALITTRPDLKIDASFVLTGEYLSVAQAKAGLKSALQARQEVSTKMAADEVVLLDAYRSLSSEMRKRVLAFALGGDLPAGPKSSSQRGK